MGGRGRGSISEPTDRDPSGLAWGFLKQASYFMSIGAPCLA